MQVHLLSLASAWIGFMWSNSIFLCVSEDGGEQDSACNEFRVVMPFSNPSLPGRRALIAVSDGTPVSYHPPPWPSQPLVWDPISTKSGQKVQQARAWSPALRRSMQTTRCSSIPTQEHAHVHARARTHTDTHAHTLHRSTIWDFWSRVGGGLE